MKLKDYSKVLQDIYYNAPNLLDSSILIPMKYQKIIENIAERYESQRGVFTVLVTLLVYKIVHPSQDIRYHQSNMEDGTNIKGFSGRAIDTTYITPTLKKLGLPSMAESGWLTRSLEQPHPYTLAYKGHIKTGKKDFLNIINYIQMQRGNSRLILAK